MSNTDFKELIEQYLTGTISDGNKAVLESKLASDVSLRAEMKTQSDMVSGLKEFRKAELKTRLDNVPLEVGVLGTLGQSAVVKVAATVGTAILLVGGMYYFSEEAVNPAPEIGQMNPITSFEQDKTAPDIALKELPSVETPAKPVEHKQQFASVASTSSATAAEDIADVAVPAAEEITPTFEKPTVAEFETDVEFEVEAVGKEDALAESDPIEINKPIDIEVKSEAGNSNKLQYQFYEERLYLYGNFEEIPYEILEINSKDGKRIYLFHQDVYYKLSYPTKKISTLEKVTNEDLLSELKIFRDNKALN
ncbi:MAG: hypothetical protein RIE86_02675 [Imperialibacter sp.]|uniref:hypothetical protein n=1 Tax=Imperialibacter sp. TaxID=2038411 RepID=UPI0032EFF532